MREDPCRARALDSLVFRCGRSQRVCEVLRRRPCRSLLGASSSSDLRCVDTLPPTPTMLLSTPHSPLAPGDTQRLSHGSEPHHTSKPSVGAGANGGRLRAAIEGGRSGRGRGAPGEAERAERRRRERAPERRSSSLGAPGLAPGLGRWGGGAVGRWGGGGEVCGLRWCAWGRT